MPPKANPRPSVVPPAQAMAALQVLEGQAQAQDAPPDEANVLRANRLLQGAFYSALLEQCKCGSCRRLRKVASLTMSVDEKEDLDAGD